jgi:hypothetical protein
VTRRSWPGRPPEAVRALNHATLPKPLPLARRCRVIRFWWHGDPVHVAVNGIYDGVKMRVIVESGSEGIIMQETRSA